MNTNTADISFIASRVIRRMVPDRSLWKAARTYLQDLGVKSFDQGNFTIVTLFDPLDGVIGAGAAKRMPEDGVNHAIGYNIALTRAVESVISSLELSRCSHNQEDYEQEGCSGKCEKMATRRREVEAS